MCVKNITLERNHLTYGGVRTGANLVVDPSTQLFRVNNFRGYRVGLATPETSRETGRSGTGTQTQPGRYIPGRAFPIVTTDPARALPTSTASYSTITGSTTINSAVCTATCPTISAAACSTFSTSACSPIGTGNNTINNKASSSAMDTACRASSTTTFYGTMGTFTSNTKTAA